MAIADLIFKKDVKSKAGGGYGISEEELKNLKKGVGLEDTPEDVRDTVDLSNVSSEVIFADEIYKRSGYDFVEDESIYRVKEFLEGFPDTMDKKSKMKSLGKILSASRVSIEGLIKDFDWKKEILENFSSASDESCENLVKQFTESIEKMKVEIENLKINITEETRRKNDQRAVIDEELRLIEDMRSYLRNEGVE